MALIASILSRLRGGRAAREAGALLAGLDGAEGAARLGLSGRAAPVWARLVRLLRGLPGPLPLVALALLLVPALLAPDWFASRLALLDHLPEAAWWLAGAGLSLAFGARWQAREQDFARTLLEAEAAPAPLSPAATGTDATLALDAGAPGDNAPLAEWLALRERG